MAKACCQPISLLVYAWDEECGGLNLECYTLHTSVFRVQADIAIPYRLATPNLVMTFVTWKRLISEYFTNCQEVEG